VTIVETRLLNPRREADMFADVMGIADRVLIDAPCSGTGTWRRNPEARWRLTPAGLSKLMAEQDRLLQLAAQLVRPGGTITYVVCSLLPAEAETRVAAFLARSPGFAPDVFSLPTQPHPVTSTILSPGVEGCDGFFIARVKRLC
jgi:16S rRNA (cytosine967-C5)-methyltransferase